MSAGIDVLPFSEDLLSLVQAFDCGSCSWDVEVNDWIKKPETDDDSALANIVSKKCSVWLYLIPGTREVVGYGSLGSTEWCFPRRKDPKQLVKIIPFIGLQARFQGHPLGSPRQDRYSWRIMGDLLVKAQDGTSDILGLFVHRQNCRAIGFYKNIGFQILADHDRPQHDHLKMWANISTSPASPP